MPRLLHILLLLVYCHYTMAGFAGAWVMKRSVRTEERAALAVPDLSSVNEGTDGDDEGDGGSESSPCDPDQCHRAGHAVPATLHAPELRMPLHAARDGEASLRPADIQTPPPRS